MLKIMLITFDEFNPHFCRSTVYSLGLHLLVGLQLGRPDKITGSCGFRKKSARYPIKVDISKVLAYMQFRGEI